MQSLLSQYSHRVMAFLIMLTLIMNGSLFSFLFSIITEGTLDNNLFPILFTMAWSFLLLATAVGLFLKQLWGYWLFYPVVVLTTIGFGVSLLPLIPSLFPLAMSPWVTIGINLVMLCVVIKLHRQALISSR